MKMTSIINVGHGDPVIFRPWWEKHQLLSPIDTQVPSIYEYQEEDFSDLITSTRKFYSLFDLETYNFSIVYGNGSTQVITAVLHTISKRLSRRIVIAYKPPVYMLMHEFLSYCNWIEITFDLTRDDIDVEVVIDPNNPSGERRYQESSASYVIFDRAYHWPIYIDSLDPISRGCNHITVYTISKLLGMGGLRLGWAFINDNNLAQEVQRSLFVIGICPNSFGMEASKVVFNRFIDDPNLVDQYNNELRDMIEQRRNALQKCSQFIVTNTSGPYAWIKSRGNIAQNLYQKYGIKVCDGIHFGFSHQYARWSLICSEDDFNSALNRLK